MAELKAPQRQLTRYEKHGTWLIIGLVVSWLLVGMAVVLRLGLLEGVDAFWFGRNLRGYTAFGLFFGILAVILGLLTFGYSMRKRGKRATDPERSSIMSWLWAHVYLGVLALVASVLHAGWGIVGGRWYSTGKLLFYAFAILIISGIAWRLIYRVLPARIQPQIGNYSSGISTGRAASALVEIEKVAAGKSDKFHALKDKLVIDGAALSTLNSGVRELDSAEQVAFQSVLDLAAKRTRGLKRAKAQARYNRFLHGLKFAHIPLAFLFPILLLVHIVAVTEIPTDAAPAVLDGYHPVDSCSDCHAEIVAEWKESMHAHALLSPVTIVQTNLVYEFNVKDEAVPDPQLLCNNCHGPAGVLAQGQTQATLPLDPPAGMSQEQIMEGVNCVTCHQFVGTPSTGLGGVAAFQDDLELGRTFFGGTEDAVGNSYHISKVDERFANPEQTCHSCHNVMMDRNGDGNPNDAGIDLVLQTTFREWEQEYIGEGIGNETCVTCHMPLTTRTRLADSAEIPLEQDYEAPPRQVRSHGFVGVDYPIDKVAISDPQLEERQALLRSAAIYELIEDQVSIDPDTGDLLFAVTIDNNQLGHKLPTGFAFARQMWVEVVITDQDGNQVYTSGLLANNVADLCDFETMTDAMAEFVVGCDEFDPQLVNLQQKLVDDVDVLRDENGDIFRDPWGNSVGIQAETGNEVALQNLNGGAVARTRPSDGQVLARISPVNDIRTFEYRAPLPAGVESLNISTRLLFRNLPPYFLRNLAHLQSPEDPDLGSMIQNLIIIEMASETATFDIEQ